MADPRRLRRFVAFVGPDKGDRVLDAAAGTGLLALAFARRVRQVVALVAGEALIDKPRLARRSNISPRQGTPQAIPFPDDSFDIVTCGSSFHHLSAPREVLAEMARVCRPGGRVALEDIVASEQEVRARYQNRLEKLRDRSHPGYLRLSEFISLLGQAGLLVCRAQRLELERELNEWLIGARPPLRRVELIRRLMTGGQEADLSGLDIRTVDDAIVFRQQLAWIIAEKPE